MLICYILAFSAGGYTNYIYDNLVLKPALVCKNETTGAYESCEVDYVCSNIQVQYEIDWSDRFSLKNWVEQLDILCNY